MTAGFNVLPEGCVATAPDAKLLSRLRLAQLSYSGSSTAQGFFVTAHKKGVRRRPICFMRVTAYHAALAIGAGRGKTRLTTTKLTRLIARL